MKVLRVHLKGWTASFRYPMFITGYQPTLPVPPLSTIYGLLSSARGEYTTPDDTAAGYVMKSEAKSTDLETIYMLSSKKGVVSNVCKREFLYNPDLYIYLTNLDFENYFKKPVYPLLLGRSSDLVMVDKIETIELYKNKNKIRVGKCVVPFGEEGVWGPLQALPTYFTNDIPREAVGVKPFYVLEDFIEYEGDNFLYDEELDWGVFIHG